MILRFIFFLLLFYFISNLVRRLFYRPASQAAGSHNAGNNRREGEVSIKYRPKQAGTSNKKVGEYVDYEELEG